jgi:hypothetical protein
MKPLHLIQPQELYGPEERRAELMAAWRINATIFDIFTPVHGRPDFTDLFALCLPDAINVIANADICFDETIHEARYIPGRTVYALSRWDKVGGGLVPYHKKDAQDAWIIADGPHTIDAPVKMGVPGVDNVLVHLLRAQYFDVVNPCKSIRAIHMHESNYRTYGEGRGKPKAYRYGPPYEFAEPCSL